MKRLKKKTSTEFDFNLILPEEQRNVPDCSSNKYAYGNVFGFGAFIVRAYSYFCGHKQGVQDGMESTIVILEHGNYIRTAQTELDKYTFGSDAQAE